MHTQGGEAVTEGWCPVEDLVWSAGGPGTLGILQDQAPAPVEVTARIPAGAQARVKIYPDSAHGFLFQHHAEFAADVGEFLAAGVKPPPFGSIWFPTERRVESPPAQPPARRKRAGLPAGRYRNQVCRRTDPVSPVRLGPCSP